MAPEGSAAQPVAGLGPLVAALSIPNDDPEARRAAGAVLAAPDPASMFATLYRPLLKHKTLPLALGHLEASGGDLSALALPAGLYQGTYPLNRLLPARPPDDRVTLAELRQMIQEHRALQDADVARLLDEFGSDRFVLLTGYAWAALYPEFPRWCADADLFAPDLDTGLGMLDHLCDRMGYVMHGCKLARLDVDGFALLKTFRMAGDHEMNIGVMAGGHVSGFLSVPLMIGPLEQTARRVEHDGREVLACSPEDLVLTTVLRPIREGALGHRGTHDLRFLLVHEQASLDWDYLVRTARANRLGGALLHVARQAERAEGRELVPAEVARSLAPGRLEARVVAGLYASGKGRRKRRAWMPGKRTIWQFWFLRSAVGFARAVAHHPTDRIRTRAFKKRMRTFRAGGHDVPVAPGFASLCELRAGAAPEAVGRCLSRQPKRPRPPGWFGDRQRRVVAAMERHLPDRGEERGFRKRTTKEPGEAQPHRCEAFEVSLLRTPRPARSRDHRRVGSRARPGIRAIRQQRWAGKIPAESFWYIADPPDELVELLREQSWPAGGAALDVGCGPGVVTAALAGRFPITIGMDVAAGALSQARDRTVGKDLVAFTAAEAPALPFRDSSFSLIFDRGVLHHIPRAVWPRYFEEMSRVLVSGGLYLQYCPQRPLPPLLSPAGVRARGARLTGRKKPVRVAMIAAVPGSLEPRTIREQSFVARDGTVVPFVYGQFRKRGPAPVEAEPPPPDFMGKHELVDLSSRPALPSLEPLRMTRRIDRLPSLRNPKLVPLPAIEHLPPDEVSFGVRVDGEHRLYPASLLKKYMVIHDRLGDQALVVAFCGRCVSASGLDPDSSGRALTFHVFGGHQGTMAMQDDQTGTVWSPVSGEALAGPLAGRHLAGVQVETTTLGAWRARHPDSRVPEESRWVPPWRPPGGPLREWQRLTIRPDDRLDPRARVLGVRLAGQRRAYELDPAPPGPSAFNDEVGGVPMVLLASPGSWPLAYERRTSAGVLEFHLEGGRIVDRAGSEWAEGRAVSGPLAGEVLTPVHSTLTTWHAWAGYHPATDVVVVRSVIPTTAGGSS